ncbi:phosphatidylethanolamine-binding protein 4 isoform X2 [Cynoglossus semilaevis]|nr:phosphatidylethanolamine-binding protein 4 isoform X2 [Cynoglossus semilaevis]
MLGFVYVETSSDSLSTLDLSFCYGGLEVIYPELDIDRCLVIPKEGNLREKLSIEWRDPQIFYPGANMNKTYVLVMVDPDAPSRSNPKAAYWRHWLVTDIQGESLKNGEVHGTTLTDYHPPTPSPMTGFHRYQFMVFEQPSDVMVSLTDEEKSSRASWNLQVFVTRFNFGSPVAALQYLTQHYKD